MCNGTVRCGEMRDLMVEGYRDSTAPIIIMILPLIFIIIVIAVVYNCGRQTRTHRNMGEGGLFSARSVPAILGVVRLFGIEPIQTIDLYSSNLYVNIVNIIHDNHQICKSSLELGYNII